MKTLDTYTTRGESPLDDQNDGSAVNPDMLRVIGFAFDRTWMNALFLTALPSVSMVSDMNEFSGTFYFVEIGTCSIFMAITIFLIIAQSPFSWLLHLAQRTPRPFADFAGGGIAAVGIFLVAAYSFGLLDWAWTSVVSGFLTGVGEGILLLQWGRSFCGARRQGVGFQLGISVLLGGTLAWMLSLWGKPIMIVAAAAFPLASSFSLHCIAKQDRSENHGKAEREAGFLLVRNATSAFFFKYIAKLVLVTFLLSIALSSIRLLCSDAALIGDSQIYAPIAAGLICIALFYWNSRLEHRELRYIYRIIITLTFLGLASLFLFKNYSLSDLIARTGLFSFEVFFFLTAINMSYQLKAHPFLCIATIEFGYLFGEYAGLILCEGTSFQALSEIPQSAIIGSLLILIFIGYAYVFTEEDIVSAESCGLYTVDDKAEYENLPKIIPEQKPSSTVGAASLTDTMSAVMKKCVEEAGRKHALSQREMDVLMFLAMGYSRKAIQKELFLSEGTVNTHITHIYQKLGIRKREEILQVLTNIDTS